MTHTHVTELAYFFKFKSKIEGPQCHPTLDPSPLWLLRGNYSHIFYLYPSVPCLYIYTICIRKYTHAV